MSRRRFGTAWFGAAIVGSLVGTVALAGTGLGAGAALRLTIDASGGLTTASALAPGHVTERCVAIGYQQGAAIAADLGLYATAGGSGLADYLDVTIEQGTGGTYSSCAGFAGSVVYTGTLAALAQVHGDPTTQLPLGMTNTGDGVASYRFRVSVRDDNRAQGTTASAVFACTGTSNATDPEPSEPDGPGATDPAPDPTRPPTKPAPDPAAPTELPGAQPTDPVATGGPAVPSSATPRPKPSATVTTSLLPTPSAEPSGAPAPDDGSAAAPVGGGWRERLGAIVEAIRDWGPAALRGAAIALGVFFPWLLLFLLVQRHIDKRDPKLALAPSYADAYVRFDVAPAAMDGWVPTRGLT